VRSAAAIRRRSECNGACHGDTPSGGPRARRRWRGADRVGCGAHGRGRRVGRFEPYTTLVSGTPRWPGARRAASVPAPMARRAPPAYTRRVMAEKSLHEQREQRLRNLASLEERGFEAYPYAFAPTTTPPRCTPRTRDGEPGDAWPDEEVTVAGRAMTVRNMGKVTFATLRDASGDLQVYLQRDRLGEPTAPSRRSTSATGSRCAATPSSPRPASSPSTRPPGGRWSSRCGRCPTSSTAWPTRRRATGSATST
jgi:hypothetical protein